MAAYTLSEVWDERGDDDLWKVRKRVSARHADVRWEGRAHFEVP